MSDRVPAGVRWILGFAGRLVPTHRRAAWRRQWVAELEHRCSDHGPGEGLVNFAMGSIAHAIYLRREEMTMRGWTADLRHSARALLRRPGFSLLTVATLAFGIGAATAIFSLAEAIMLRPLPLEDPTLEDIAPTILTWFSLEVPPQMNGRSVFEPRAIVSSRN